MLTENSPEEKLAPIPSRIKLGARFVFLMFAFGYYVTTYQSLPVIFFRPKLECEIDGEFRECTEDEMCQNGYNYRFEKDFEGIQSISMLKDLYCERKIIEAVMQGLPFVGQIIGFMSLLLIKVDSKDLYRILSYTMCLTASIMFIPYLTENLVVISSIIFVQNFCYTIMVTYVYQYARTYCPPEYKDRVIALINLGYPLVSMIYVIFSYFDGYWKNYFLKFNGTIGVICAIASFIVWPSEAEQNLTPQMKILNSPDSQNQRLSLEQQQIQQQDTFKENLAKVLRDSTLRKNMWIWIFAFVAPGLSYMGCMIALNSIGGNIFVNMFFSTVLELIGGFIAQVKIAKADHLQFTKQLSLMIALAYFASIVLIGPFNNTIDSDNLILMTIQLSPIVLGKISHEIMYPFVLVLLEKYFPVSMQTFTQTFGNVITLIIVALQPFYKYLMTDVLRINQFLIYGALFYCVEKTLQSFQNATRKKSKDIELHLIEK